MHKIADILVCPLCKKTLQVQADCLTCDTCKKSYMIKDNIPVFTNGKEYENDAMHYISHYSIDGEMFDYYQKCDAQLEHDDRRMHQFVFRHVPRQVEKILDVGAGANWVTENAIPKGIEVHAADLSHRNIKIATEKYKHGKYYGVVADAYALPYPDNTFDVIIASEIIEHVIEPGKFVKNLFSFLKPGGRLIITCPYKEKIQQNLCIHCNKLTPSNAHLHSFDKEKILEFFKDYNKGKIKVRTHTNKLLSIIRSYIIIKFFPYLLWRVTDYFINLLIPKPSRMLVVYNKYKE